MEVEGGDPLPHAPCTPRWEGSKHTQCVHGLAFLPEHLEHGGMDGGVFGCMVLGPTLPGSLLTGGPSRPLWPFAPLMPLGPGVRFWNENKTKTPKSVCVRGHHLSFQMSDEPCFTTEVLSEVAVPN